ncbi:unnamed protein product [Owenia fusiformis]|uniref:NudC domain-containing protein 1 n=1 Tax=Owenia fusiformis TaxID=6347 RepID=A0A8J1TTL2_OWEFU|nr:unnamed protein product [Owenia fusiformis]
MDFQVELKVNRNLLDPNFDGYKLSLEALPTYEVPLESNLDETKLTTDQYSYQHIKAYGLHNHIYVDQHNTSTVYFVDDKWRVMRLCVQLESSFDPPTVIFEIPDARDVKQHEDRCDCSIYLPSPELAVLSDGAGNIYILETGDRASSIETWKIIHKHNINTDDDCDYDDITSPNTVTPIVLQHALLYKEDTLQKLELLLVEVKPNPTEDDHRKQPFVTVLKWLTLSSGGQGHWWLERTRYIEGFSAADYSCVDYNGAGVYVGSEKPFKMTYDSLHPIVEKKPDTEQHIPAPPPAYTWSQTEEDVTLTFTLPPGTNKPDVYYKLSRGRIELGIKNGEELLVGDLHDAVDIDGSTWTLEGQRLEVTLAKSEGVQWPGVVPTDKRGEMVFDPAQVAEIHERLAHLTSDQWNPDPQPGKEKAYNSEQLEDCDSFPEDSACLQRIDGESHEVSHQANLGTHQWLFQAWTHPLRLPSLCLRHDVDGLLWQPKDKVETGESPWKHTGTFNALGYVQASKRDKKYVVCSPNMSYAVISDCVRHIYIYRQPTSTLSPLRNRKTGQEVSTVSKQQMVSIASTENILGLQATNNRLFVCTKSKMYIIKVLTDED